MIDGLILAAAVLLAGPLILLIFFGRRFIQRRTADKRPQPFDDTLPLKIETPDPVEVEQIHNRLFQTKLDGDACRKRLAAAEEIGNRKREQEARMVESETLEAFRRRMIRIQECKIVLNKPGMCWTQQLDEEVNQKTIEARARRRSDR